MKWFTHIGFSVLIFLLLQKLFEIEESSLTIFGVIACIIGGIVVDSDIYFKILTKHRGLIHSFIGLFLFSLPILIILSFFKLHLVAIFFMAGYFFHLFLDAYTPYGVKWLPFFPRSKGPIHTGSLFEKILAITIWILVIIFILM